MTGRPLWVDRGPVRRWLSDMRSRLGLRRSNRTSWRQRWKDPAYAPPWPQIVAPEVQRAVESGWLPAGAAVLDVGCGAGVIAEWLGSAGYDVTAVDFAEGAVALTRRRTAHLGDRVRAELVDIAAAPPPGGPFGAFVDRGCFHALLPGDAVRYGRNVAAVCARGAHGVVAMPIPAELYGAAGNDFRRRRFQQKVIEALGPHFSVELQPVPAVSDASERGGGEELEFVAYLERR